VNLTDKNDPLDLRYISLLQNTNSFMANNSDLDFFCFLEKNTYKNLGSKVDD
jgi:hypothetical protein